MSRKDIIDGIADDFSKPCRPALGGTRISVQSVCPMVAHVPFKNELMN